ncbi:hypothetical protein NMY22_g20217 [Coprinellus aureogranulatus]|nr:hypothetical protein NMY22_g20217 [Coprinellus aureogranulatus]
MFPFNGETNAEPISILPTSTLRGFANDTGGSSLKPPAPSPGKPSATSPGGHSIRSQSRASSSASSSSKSVEAQVFRTPKAQVEEETDSEDYVSVSPPKDPGSAPTKGTYRDVSSSSHSASIPFNRRADFYVVPTTPSSPVPRNAFHFLTSRE